MKMPGTIGGANIIFKNNYMEKIGIIGYGFVGGAIANALEMDAELFVMDPAKGHNATYEDLMSCSGIFVCVPTPQDDDGTCDTSILGGILNDLHSRGYTGVVISKCTAPPDWYEAQNIQHTNLIHAPEFLTAANAIRDYANGEFAFIGGRVAAYRKEAERIIRLSQRNLKSVTLCTIAEAAMAKYAINTFMATKVVFMNELEALCSKTSVDYNNVAYMVMKDNRIGTSHMQVPGPDGNYGFGGACFPKDTTALLKYAEQKGAVMNVLDAAVKKNTLLRLTESK
jgi:nucleotide sugar dehydrogenase